ncbi:hypothetical protein ADU59_02445 [Pararhizobium polonicum]|uniref:Phage ABA sandwich domain-containing protein n=1 Tax=Pararhizobium polonicum TaxID=1612624 RepID=A0A1C7P5S4_9HYPH|nr:hypothetical protein [Pararhizobium polonicum]OBZ96632.1 hypothetical protein ADU59_02445 [Pararhizobium polonicum]
MAISDLILQLQHAKEPSKELDISIGIVMGYKRHVKTVEKEDGSQKERKVVWLYPNNGNESSLPAFTAKLDDAYFLAQSLVPGCVGGVSWDSRGGTARIDDGPYFTATTPALALCIAALSVKHFQQDAESK